MDNTKFRKLGYSNDWVNPVGFGTAYLAIQNRPSEKEAIKLICAVLDEGVNFIDTADAYCLDENDMGYAERLLTKALNTWNVNHKIIIATKGGVTRPNGTWGRNGDPNYIINACELSLQALKRDSIDLYQLHAPDDNIPFLDTLRAFIKLKEQGKIQHIGLSNVDLKQIQEARKWTEILTVQNLLHPFHTQDFQNGIIEYCMDHHISYLPYSPLGGADHKHLVNSDPLLKQIGANHGINAQQVVLAWMLAKSKNIIPIPGTIKLDHFLLNNASQNITLDKATIETLDNAFFKAKSNA